MFHGSVPADMRSIMHEYASGWSGDVWIGCSGNMTIERVLTDYGNLTLHSNDVQAYSCALGWYFAGEPVPFEVKDESADELDWLTPYLDGGAGTLATIMLGTRFLDFVGREGRYYQRMITATREQFDRMHEHTKQKVEELPLRLGSFAPMDVREWLRDRVPANDPVAMFPPFWAGDYEAQFASIDKHFTWPAPTYPDLDEAGKNELVEMIADRPEWVIGLHVEREELRPHLKGLVQTTNRGVPIYVYARTGSTRIVRPQQPLEPIPMPKLGPGDDIGDRMALHVLTSGQFSMIRSQFMARSIKPGQPLLACAVSVDGQIVGAFACSGPKFEPTEAYMLSDFPVSWSKYKHLAKLVIVAALSRETQLLLQRSLSQRVLSLTTTAFTDRPVSMKYRSVMKLGTRKDADDGLHKFQLKYDAPIGQWDLAEGLQMWKDRWGSALKKGVAANA